MRFCILAVLLGLTASPAIADTCAPPTLTKIVTRSVGPGIARGTFRAEPIVMYRLGERFMRTEEAPEPETNQHLLIVAASPDVWFVNLMDGAGKHIVDPGPTYQVKAPIVAGQGVPRDFLELEFGCEADFAKSRAHAAGTRAVAGEPAKIYALQQGDRRLEILLSNRGAPAEVAYYQGEKTVLVIRYDTYETGLPDDPALFRRPEGVAYRKAAQP